MTSLKFIPKKMMLLLLGDACIIAGAYFLAQSIWYMSVQCSFAPSWPEAVFLLAYLFIFYVAEFYDGDLHFATARYLFKHLAATGAGAVLVAVVFFMLPHLKSGRGVFLMSAVLIGVSTYAWRRVFEWWFKNGSKAKKRLLIVGAGKAGRMLYHAIKDHPDYQALGFMVDDDPAKWEPSQVPAVIGGSDGLRKLIKGHGVRVLVLAITNFKEPDLLKSALDCKLDGVSVYDMPSFYEKVTGKVPVEHVTDFWLVFTPLLGVKKSAYTQKVKRIFDVVLSFFGLIIALPLAGLIAAAIKLESGGPVLYLQPRVGLNGDKFKLVKFRSMKNGTDYDRKFAGERHDPRVTRVGKFIRFFRMDEIPQMWNVLKGEISFIGPRALIEEEVRNFEEKIPYFSLRHSVRPGITGWAQVNYRHGTRVEDGLEKLQYDLFYIKNLSPLLDFHILTKTVKVVLSGKGAR